MPAPLRMTNEQLVDAYRSTGSVWKAAKALGVTGQSVWERLRAIGHPLASSAWTDDELAELRALAGTCPIGEVARRLGRTYAGVASKVSELGISGRSPRAVKLPRGAGYDKATTTKRMAELRAFAGGLRAFCRARGLDIEGVVHAFQRHCPDEWLAYSKERTDIGGAICGYCGRIYYPMNARQKNCSRRCSSEERVDREYFGGKRRQAVGIADKTCQLCERKCESKLAAHHVLGKDNDPDNNVMVALCNGCHQAVTLLGARAFADTEKGWQNFIGLVVARRRGADKDYKGTYIEVEIEDLTEADLEQIEAEDEMAAEADELP